MDSVSTKRMTALVIFLAALCAYTWTLRLRSAPAVDPPDLESIPRSLGGYSASDEYISPKSLQVLGADLTLARSYTDGDGREIDLFIGYFARQQENSQIHSPKHCYPGAGWDIISEGRIDLDIDGLDSPARKLVISNGTDRQIVVYWFSMRGMMIPGEFSLKWRQMTSALLGRPQAAFFIRFSAPLPPGKDEEVEKEMVEFVGAIAPYLVGALAPAGNREDGS